jgi:hypothetical protein
MQRNANAEHEIRFAIAFVTLELMMETAAAAATLTFDWLISAQWSWPPLISATDIKSKHARSEERAEITFSISNTWASYSSNLMSCDVHE